MMNMGYIHIIIYIYVCSLYIYIYMICMIEHGWGMNGLVFENS